MKTNKPPVPIGTGGLLVSREKGLTGVATPAILPSDVTTLETDMARKGLAPTEYVMAKHSVRALRANSAAGVSCTVKAIRVHLPAGTGQYDAMHYQHVECPGCGGRMDKERIMGGNTKGTPCNGKCMGATGPACDCWCSGANHGGSHAA